MNSRKLDKAIRDEVGTSDYVLIYRGPEDKYVMFSGHNPHKAAEVAVEFANRVKPGAPQ